MEASMESSRFDVPDLKKGEAQVSFKNIHSTLLEAGASASYTEAMGSSIFCSTLEDSEQARALEGELNKMGIADTNINNKLLTFSVKLSEEEQKEAKKLYNASETFNFKKSKENN